MWHTIFTLSIGTSYILRARDKGSIRVNYSYVLGKYSISFKNLVIDTQLIWQRSQLFPDSWVKKFQGQKSMWMLFNIMITVHYRWFYSSYDKYVS